MRTSRFYLAISMATLASAVLSVISIFASSGAWLVVGLVAFVLSALASIVDWRSKAHESKALYTDNVAPEPYEYDEVYSDWIRLNDEGMESGIIYSPLLDDNLRSEAHLIELHRSGRWTPKGPAREVWRRWGGKPGQFNETKIRLASDLMHDSTSVVVNKTDYASYVATNGLADLAVFDRSHAVPPVTFSTVGLRLGVIPTFALSQCSNHLGGDLLLVGDGRIWLQVQSHKNLVQPNSLQLSASGSFDWDTDARYCKDLTTLAKIGLLRELSEELGLKRACVPTRQDVRIIRFARATYTGGKPQFLALARTRYRDLPVNRRAEGYTKAVLPIEFHTARGLAGVIDALVEAGSSRGRVGRPYAVMIATLRQMVESSDPVGDWLFFKDE